ncbi:single-stranded-DNA-specific exonuclease RecJ [Patescibacteria group bacterium]|nr:single-stranded-DNA-specific exonuclease RecJ [Patescibacteria group bacterium]MBU4115620.1 single-stranded-DNA-specific exonuclease RecJ [Patescibacteria group bacterium]
MKYKVSKNLDSKTEKELQNYPELTRKLLSNRGIKTAKDAGDFLNLDYEKHTHDPFLMKGMKKAVKGILDVIKNDEKIVIFSDYDMDGIPGAVAFHDFFKKIKYENFINYIPHRNKEGFGLNKTAIKEFSENNTKLLITIDCGITNVEEVKLANKLGIDVIITDHHLENSHIPKAFAILNPKQKDESYPFKNLCGAGVIFKLIQALIKRGNEEKMFEINNGWEKWLLDMVGMATIADMVPLVGENRIFAYYGLKVLKKSPRVGLVKLLKKIGVNQDTLSEDDIGFMIGPRINAASRMDVPMEAFNLLTTTDEVEADRLALHLNKINNERKGVVASIIKEIKKNYKHREDRGIIVMGDPRWSPGLVGLACNTLTENYKKPVFLWGRDENSVIKGSCRSDGVLDLVELMTEMKTEIFIEYGGHSFSGGFSVQNEKIHFLEEELNLAHERLKNKKQDKSVKIKEDLPAQAGKILVDDELSIDDINFEKYSQIETMSPFGEGNPRPLFLFRNLEINKVSVFGKSMEHLKLEFRNSLENKIEAISFFGLKKEESLSLENGQKINIVANIEKSNFGRFPQLRLRIVGFFNSGGIIKFKSNSF